MHSSEGEESAALSGTDAGDRPEWSVSPARSPHDSERSRGVDTVKLPVWGQGHAEASSGIPYFTGMGSLRPRTGPAPTAHISATAVTAEPTDLPEEQNQGYWRDVEDGDGGVGEADDAESATHETGADGEVSAASPWPRRGTRQARQTALARRMLRQAEDEIGSEWCSVVSSGWSSHTEGEESDARGRRSSVDDKAAPSPQTAAARWPLSIMALQSSGGMCGDCEPMETWPRHPVGTVPESPSRDTRPPRMELPAEQRGSAYIRQRKGEPLYYDTYLRLDRLLSAQAPLSWQFGEEAHDEMLFITVHQVYELWFKQLVHELDSVRQLLLRRCPTGGDARAAHTAASDNRTMNLVLHRLERMVEIQRLLVEQIRVLETMTPQEFLAFRDYLFPASGFQSWQYRVLEVKLGVRAEQRISNHWKSHLSPAHQQLLSRVEQEPSLFDAIQCWLEQMPFVAITERAVDGPGDRASSSATDAPPPYNFWEAYRRATERMLQLDEDFIERESLPGVDRARAYRELARMRQMFRSVYCREAHHQLVERGQRRMRFEAIGAALLIMLYEQEAPYLQLPHRVLRCLLELDEGMAQWRFRHVQMVSRMIGSKSGTGGSLGVHYLTMTVEASRVFTDLSGLATLLIPQRLLPPLPPHVRQQLEYAYTRSSSDERPGAV